MKKHFQKSIPLIKELLIKALIIGVGSYLIEHLWLDRQPWIVDMPLTGYSYEQKLLQDNFLDSKRQSPVVVFDISQSLPSLASELQSEGKLTNGTEDQRENFKNAAMLLEQISNAKPTAIALDWDISDPKDMPRASQTNLNPNSIRFDLWKSIRECTLKGIPVYFGADRFLKAGGHLSELQEPYKHLACTLEQSSPKPGSFSDVSLVKGEGDIETLPVAIAEFKGLRGVRESQPLELTKSRFFSMSPDEESSKREKFLINYEAVPAMIQESLDIYAKNGPIPAIADARIGKQFTGRVVILGDLLRPSPGDTANYPISGASLNRFRSSFNAIVKGESADKEKAIDTSISLISTSGVLYQASAIHTLLGNQVLVLTGPLSEFIFATMIGGFASLLKMLFLSILLTKRKFHSETAYAEIHRLFIELFVAIVIIPFLVLWFCGQTHIHHLLVPGAPAILLSCLIEGFGEAAFALVVVRRHLHHQEQKNKSKVKPESEPAAPAQP